MFCLKIFSHFFEEVWHWLVLCCCHGYVVAQVSPTSMVILYIYIYTSVVNTAIFSVVWGASLQ